jgi:hypothetical protein
MTDLYGRKIAKELHRIAKALEQILAAFEKDAQPTNPKKKKRPHG